MAAPSRKLSSEDNRMRPEDRAAHDWYRFVLSFPPHLVRTYLDRFAIAPGQRVLDPFCGTGTTLVECKKLGLASVGVERNPMAAFASSVKLSWGVDAEGLVGHAARIAKTAQAKLNADGLDDDAPPSMFARDGKDALLRDLPVEARRLLLRDSVSPRPL